jgi:hypothetical protein
MRVGMSYLLFYMRCPGSTLRATPFGDYPSRTAIKQQGQSKSGSKSLSKSNISGAGRFDHGPDPDFDPDETSFFWGADRFKAQMRLPWSAPATD